ncbi:hypothetical protein BAE44_0000419 [Dichanthelium oligosanthes]|uniref:F-box domain-containing protein n=1 Tax=Dichanthelium oligosanthes TaxID=888268 RepID=A0A1E5WMJ0_9POAL|nr:hypothetical protein BAE44_0000419 [Dichanthelium oligosanthes]
MCSSARPGTLSPSTAARKLRHPLEAQPIASPSGGGTRSREEVASSPAFLRGKKAFQRPRDNWQPQRRQKVIGICCARPASRILHKGERRTSPLATASFLVVSSSSNQATTAPTLPPLRSPARPAAMAAHESWDNVPLDLVVEIARHVRCPFDRLSMSKECRAWCEAVLQRRRPHLPWLLLPYNCVALLPFGAPRRARFFCASCDANHVVRVPGDTDGARFFGAYQGGWVFIAYGQDRGHALVNLNGGHESIRLPASIPWIAPPSQQQSVYMLAATLSAPAGSKRELRRRRHRIDH